MLDDLNASKNKKKIACLVGSLVGDGWMKLPGLCELAVQHYFWFDEPLRVISGSYALPVWEWGRKNLRNAIYYISEVIEDPDEANHPFCPGIGHPSMDAAMRHVSELYPDASVIGGDKITTCYYRDTPKLNTKTEFEQGNWVAIHPYTAHNWKNCRNVVRKADYPLPVKVLGVPGEYANPQDCNGFENCTLASFDEQVAIVAGCRYFVGVGSSWSNVASLFHKPMIHVSYTPDLAQFTNPEMVKLVEPSLTQLQFEIHRMNERCAA